MKMDKTGDEAIEEILRAFYEQKLAAAACSLRENGKSLSVSREEPGDGDGSYYEIRTDSGPYVCELNEDKYAEDLERIWRDSGLEELAELSASLIRLAEEIRDDRDDGEVSSFIYAMY